MLVEEKEQKGKKLILVHLFIGLNGMAEPTINAYCFFIKLQEGRDARPCRFPDERPDS